jgi:hypothetical protein
MSSDNAHNFLLGSIGKVESLVIQGLHPRGILIYQRL